MLRNFGETRGPARVPLDQAIPSGIDRERLGLPQIPVRLAPPIFVDDIGQRNTADWPEPAQRIPDRQ
jgi:hypothetical protein